MGRQWGRQILDNEAKSLRKQWREMFEKWMNNLLKCGAKTCENVRKNATKTIAKKCSQYCCYVIFGSPCLINLIQVKVFYVWGRRRCNYIRGVEFVISFECFWGGCVWCVWCACALGIMCDILTSKGIVFDLMFLSGACTGAVSKLCWFVCYFRCHSWIF